VTRELKKERIISSMKVAPPNYYSKVRVMLFDSILGFKNVSAQLTMRRHSQNVKSTQFVNITTTLYSFSPLLIGACFTRNPICISSSNIISHSLRSMPVDGEYCLSTKEHLIQGENSPGSIRQDLCNFILRGIPVTAMTQAS
jgi:hypothetical protein